MRLRHLPLLLALPLAACTPTDSLDSDASLDNAQSAFTTQPTSAMELAVMELVNTASLAVLDDGVGLDSRAATGIVANRPLADLDALDAVPYVGNNALTRLIDYINAQASAPVVHGVTEGSDEAAAILLLVNLGDYALLDDVVGLNSQAADNIAAARFLAPIASLVELDAVSYVGASAFSTLLDYVVDEGLVLPQVFVHGLSSQSITAFDVLELVNSATLEALDELVELDSRAAANIVTARDIAPLTSLTELDAIGYVGPSAFGALVDFVTNGYAGDPCYDGLGLNCTWEEESRLIASNAQLDDKFGDAVAIDGDLMVVSAPYEDGCSDDPLSNYCTNAGAVYVFRRDPAAGLDAWLQEAVLKPLDAAGSGSVQASSYGYFGDSVAISGDTIVVGAEYDDSCTDTDNSWLSSGCDYSGAAYVYRRAVVNGSPIWNQEAFLKAETPRTGDYFGGDVSLDGDLLAIGAGGDANCRSGINPASWSAQDTESCTWSGGVHVFNRTESTGGPTWNREAYIKASAPDAWDSFFEVAVSGNFLAVGADGDDSCGSDPLDDTCSNAGSVTMFERVVDGGPAQWSQTHYIKASNPGVFDRFGSDVALDLDTLAVGAEYEDGCTGGTPDTSDACSGTGAVYVFVASEQVGAMSWDESAYIKATAPSAYDGFGGRVALREDTLATSARWEDGCGEGDDACSYAGAGYVFQRDASEQWSEEARTEASDAGASQYYGGSVAITDGSVVFGSTGAINESACGPAEGSPCSTGAAYVVSLTP